MRVIGLDIGRKRIGVAVSDENASFALPHSVIDASLGRGPVIGAIQKLLEEYTAKTIVVGLPVGLSDQITDSTRFAKNYMKDIAKAFPAVTVVEWDERYTTTQAESIMREMGTKRDNRKKMVDKIAASIILQNYLDSRRQS